MIVFACVIILAQLTSTFGDPEIKNDLPEINEGDTCVPGKTYRIDCNRCQCTNNGQLLCTKIACYDPKYLKPKLSARKGKSKKNCSDLPHVPKGHHCIPGIVYQNGCNACICDENKQIHCGTGECDLSKRVLYPKDIHEPFTSAELNALETLEGYAEECVPGRAYKLDCNLCLCNHMKNLICEQNGCLTLDPHVVHRIAAYRNIGKTCHEGQKFEVENTCLTCSCVEGKTECTWQKTCEDPKYRDKLHNTLKLQKINPEQDKCVPGGLYRVFCNRCNCMFDGTLRCTQMSCLNYSEAKELIEEHENLARQGL